MPLPAGVLNRRVTLLAEATTQDASGGLGAGAVVATVWAKIAPMTSSEVFRSQAFTGEANIQVVIRYRPGVKANMTVQYAGPDGTRNFRILGAPLNEGERNEQLTLMCKEINDQ